MPIVALMHGIFGRNKRIEILNSYCTILKSKKIFGLKKVLGDKREKTIKNYAKIYMGFTILLSIIHIIQLIDFLAFQKSTTLYYIYKSLISVLCFINHLLNASQFLIDLNIQEVMVDAICCAFKNTILEKSENGDEIFTKWSVVRRLRKLQRLYMSLIVGNIKFNNFSNPFLLVSFLVTITMLILSSYTILILWFALDNTEQNQALWLIMEVRTQCIVLSIAYALKCCEDILKPVSITYIFKIMIF